MRGKNILETTSTIFNSMVSAYATGNINGSYIITGDEDASLELRSSQPIESDRFAGWRENGQQVCTDAVYTFKAEVNRELIAVFKKDTPAATATPGSVTAAAYYNAGMQWKIPGYSK